MRAEETSTPANSTATAAADVQLLKEWNIDRFFSRGDEKRHSSHAPTRESPSKAIPKAAETGARPTSTAAAPESNFMKNFSFIKNFKREKSDLLPLSKRHSSEISYNLNVGKYIGGVTSPQRNSALENTADRPRVGGNGPALPLRAGPRREKTESVILRRNSTQPIQPSPGSRPETQSINNQIDINSIVGGEGGSKFSGNQVIQQNRPTGPAIEWFIALSRGFVSHCCGLRII